MIIVKLPEFDVYDIEIFVTEKVRITIDVWLHVDVLHTFEDFRVLELPK